VHRPNATPQSAIQRFDDSAMLATLTPSQLRAELAAFREREQHYAEIDRRRRQQREELK
jgi:hypothetical protein